MVRVVEGDYILYEINIYLIRRRKGRIYNPLSA
jgi:hypothetical protein